MMIAHIPSTLDTFIDVIKSAEMFEFPETSTLASHVVGVLVYLNSINFEGVNQHQCKR